MESPYSIKEQQPAYNTEKTVNENTLWGLQGKNGCRREEIG